MNLDTVLLLTSGTLIIGLEGAISTFAYKLWEARGVKANAFSKTIVFLVLGALLIGIGGTLSTYGWKVQSNAAEKRAIVISVAKEWMFNSLLHNTNKYLLMDSTAMTSYGFNPRFKSDALSFALYSHLFSSDDSTDAEFLSVLTAVEQNIYRVNVKLNLTDNLSFATLDREKVAKHRLHVVESEGMKEYLTIHAQLGEYLKTNFPWAMK